MIIDEYLFVVRRKNLKNLQNILKIYFLPILKSQNSPISVQRLQLSKRWREELEELDEEVELNQILNEFEKNEIIIGDEDGGNGSDVSFIGYGGVKGFSVEANDCCYEGDGNDCGDDDGVDGVDSLESLEN